MITYMKVNFTVSEAAAITNVSSYTIYNKIYNNRLEAYKVGRQWLIPNEALEEFIRSNNTAQNFIKKIK